MINTEKKAAIKRVLPVIAIVGLVIAGCLVTDSRASKTTVTTLSSLIDSLSTDMEAYYASVNLKIESVESRVTRVEARTDTLEIRVTSVEFENDTLRALAERNARCVQKLYNEVVELGKRATETRKLAETHGRKINDISETVFKAAYGSDWDKHGKVAWDQYVLCGNQNLWDEVVKRLSPEQMQKIIQVDQLNQRITALENSPKRR